MIKRDHDALIRLDEKVSTLQTQVADLHTMMTSWLDTSRVCQARVARYGTNLKLINWIGAVIATAVIGGVVHAIVK